MQVWIAYVDIAEDDGEEEAWNIWYTDRVVSSSKEGVEKAAKEFIKKLSEESEVEDESFWDYEVFGPFDIM